MIGAKKLMICKAHLTTPGVQAIMVPLPRSPDDLEVFQHKYQPGNKDGPGAHPLTKYVPRTIGLTCSIGRTVISPRCTNLAIASRLLRQNPKLFTEGAEAHHQAAAVA